MWMGSHSVFSQVLPAILPDLQKAPLRNRKTIEIGLTRLLTQSTKMLSPPFVQQWPAALEGLLRLFLLPQDITGPNEEEEVVVADPDDLTYQASFSKLGASEAPKSDPLAQMGDPRELLTSQLLRSSQAAPGKVAQSFSYVVSIDADCFSSAVWSPGSSCASRVPRLSAFIARSASVIDRKSSASYSLCIHIIAELSQLGHSA